MADPRDRERKDSPPAPGQSTPAQVAQPASSAARAPQAADEPPRRLDETIPGGKYAVPIGNTDRTKLVNAEGREIKEDGSPVHPDQDEEE